MSEIGDLQRDIEQLREKCTACAYTIIIEWLAEYLDIDPTLLEPKFHDMDSDGIVFDMVPDTNQNDKHIEKDNDDTEKNSTEGKENDAEPTSQKKYVTLVAMESDKPFVSEECKKNEEAMKYMSNLALTANMVFGNIQKTLSKNNTLEPEKYDIIQSLALTFDKEKYCFCLVFKNNAYFMRNQLIMQFYECKKLYEHASENERKDIDIMLEHYKTDLETKFTDAEIQKNEDLLEIWRNKYNSKCCLFICVEDAEDNEELDEQLLNRLEPVAPLLFEVESVSIVEKVKRTFE